jgi:hypothetical protein
VHAFHFRERNLVARKEAKAQAKAEVLFNVHTIVHAFHLRQKTVSENWKLEIEKLLGYTYLYFNARTIVHDFHFRQ